MRRMILPCPALGKALIALPKPVKAMIEAEAGTVELAEPKIQTRTRPSEGDPANDWLCAWCLNRVASEKDRFLYDGKSEFSFRNPEGIRFEIVTFSRVTGCRLVGVPTSEATWFPNHAWCHCLCEQCGLQLGWQYTGPTEFVGLILGRIVRALLIRS